MEDDDFGKPGTVRRFPWRLWLFAIAMTAGAGAGGYYAWQFRSKAKDCDASLGPMKEASSQLATCKTDLDTASKKSGELEKQNNEFTKNLSASKDELAQLRLQKAEADRRMAAVEEIRKQFAKL